MSIIHIKGSGGSFFRRGHVCDALPLIRVIVTMVSVGYPGKSGHLTSRQRPARLGVTAGSTETLSPSREQRFGTDTRTRNSRFGPVQLDAGRHSRECSFERAHDVITTSLRFHDKAG